MCAYPECGKEAYCRGYCNGHYRQWLKLSKRKSVLPTVRSLTPLRVLGSRDGGCEVCGDPIKSSGLCNRHYTQMFVHGRLTPELERV